MYPAPFAYHRPDTVEGAIATLDQPDVRVLAGGHSLLQMLKIRETTVEGVVDISEIETLREISYGASTEETVIGAATPYAEILDDGTLERHAPMVAESIASIGDPQIRNRGTIGGNLVQADPGADLPPAALAGDARVTIAGPDGTKTIGIGALYGDEPTDPGTPAGSLSADELLTEVRIPDATDSFGTYARKTHPATGYAVVGVATRIQIEDDTITSCRIGATGLQRIPMRLAATEAGLVGSTIDAVDASEAGAAAMSEVNGVEVLADANVSSEYRRRLLGSIVEQTVSEIIGRTP